MNYFAIPALLAGLYQLLALVAALRRLRQRPPVSRILPPVSILKPVRGCEPGFAQAVRSQAGQDYPDFEMLFGSGDPRDPALDEVRRLAAEYPAGRIRVIEGCQDVYPNAKVGVLERLAREARHGMLVVSDSDITVEPGYLREVVAPLEDPAIGMVTCLYRAASFDEAIALANFSAYGLTGAIHTFNSNRIEEFVARYRAGLVSINGPTYGAGPHMPFGGVKNSGNGFREPGTEALDVYTEWKTVVVNHDPARV